MTEYWNELAPRFCDEFSLGKVQEVVPLAGGRNNRVARLRVKDKSYLLKAYYYSENDQRDRLRHEFSFMNFAWQIGCEAVPQPYFQSRQLRAALYEFVEGPTVISREINSQYIQQAVDFLAKLNEHKGQAKDIPIAADAGFIPQEHLDNTENRVLRLSQIESLDSFSSDVIQCRDARIVPLWNEVNSSIIKKVKEESQLFQALDSDERWLSPSDFGFHNTIEQSNGKIKFFDFEFAGWDDPVKLVCDFINQPDNILAVNLAEQFSESIVHMHQDKERLRARLLLLTPVFQIKWVCIILNHFLKAGVDRLRFQGSHESDSIKANQIEKMNFMLDRASLSFNKLKAWM